MKKVLVIIMVLAMVIASFAGCGKKKEDVSTNGITDTNVDKKGDVGTQKQEIVKFRYVKPGNPPKDIDMVLSEVNKKMAQDGVGIEMEIMYIPWDAWQQKVNIMLTSGETIDLLNIMNDWIPLSAYAGKGALLDITDIIEQHGPNIKKYNPEIMMNAGKIQGKNYAMPAFWVEFSRDPSITVRKDILDKYNLSVPKNAQDIINIYETVMKNWEGDQKPYLPISGQKVKDFSLAWRTYDTWPFVVYDGIFYVNQDGTISSYFETEEFKKDCELAYEMYKKGIIDPDVLVKKVEDVEKQIASGNWITGFGTQGSENIDSMKTYYPNITKEDIEHVLLSPEKVNLRPFGTRNMNAVPVTSKQPEAGVKFINWLYENQENYDLFVYGIEGVHYNKVGDKQYEPINNPDTNWPDYASDEWGIGNLQYLRTKTTGSPTCTRDLYTLDTNAVDSIAASFIFDYSNVVAEVANVQTEAQTSIVPLLTGVISYEEGYDKAIDKLKKAGLDKVIAEYKSQFEAYQAAQGK